MSQESVLWYENNILVSEYRERFYRILHEIFMMLPLSAPMKEKFLALEEYSQKHFLLVSDISTLLLNFKNFKSDSSLHKFIWELGHYLDGTINLLSSNAWEYIEWTHIRLTLSDNNPDNSIVNHPDHENGGMLWWWDKKPEEWNKIFAQSFSIIREVNHDFFMELQDMVQKIVPMKTSKDVHNSCTYKECFWTLYLGYTTGTEFPELHIVEALIHESSHNKLNLIMQSQRLHNNDYNLKYYSPYRPDARHIHGVLLWVHALVPAVYVLLQAAEKWLLTDIQWKEKIILYHIKNKLGLNVLKKHMKPTTIGLTILEDIIEVIKKCDSMIQKMKFIESLDMSKIQGSAKRHFLQVREEYPGVQY